MKKLSKKENQLYVHLSIEVRTYLWRCIWLGEGSENITLRFWPDPEGKSYYFYRNENRGRINQISISEISAEDYQSKLDYWKNNLDNQILGYRVEKNISNWIFDYDVKIKDIEISTTSPYYCFIQKKIEQYHIEQAQIRGLNSMYFVFAPLMKQIKKIYKHCKQTRRFREMFMCGPQRESLAIITYSHFGRIFVS